MSIHNEINLHKGGVWIYAEIHHEKLLPVSYELLGEAKKLARKLGVKTYSIIIGGVQDNLKQFADKLISYGSDMVYIVEHQRYHEKIENMYANVLYEMINQGAPEIMLFGATFHGRSIAPRVATRLGTGLTADCTALDIDESSKLLLQTRPTFGGSLMATIITPHHKPQMATVRPNTMKKPALKHKQKGTIIKPNIPFTEKPTMTILKTVSNHTTTLINLIDADIVVAVGRGFKTKSQIAMAQKFAERIGGALAASRAIVDAGLLSYSCQVGQTGRSVSPKIYIALGISGAIQHIAGMSSSQVIIAINKDSAAPIFEIADYGIVADVCTLLPCLLKELG